jgi:hypothetical protein
MVNYDQEKTKLSPQLEIEYWKQRCYTIEARNDQLVDEIYKLRGFRHLTKEEIDKHNEEVDKINPTNHLQTT